MPTAVEIEPDWADELWVKDARLEDISGPAFVFGMEKSPRTEINMEGVPAATCRFSPRCVTVAKTLPLPPKFMRVKIFSHGLNYADMGAVPEIRNPF